jgi:hypothetical protein
MTNQEIAFLPNEIFPWADPVCLLYPGFPELARITQGGMPDIATGKNGGKVRGPLWVVLAATHMLFALLQSGHGWARMSIHSVVRSLGSFHP